MELIRFYLMGHAEIEEVMTLLDLGKIRVRLPPRRFLGRRVLRSQARVEAR